MPSCSHTAHVVTGREHLNPSKKKEAIPYATSNTKVAMMWVKPRKMRQLDTRCEEKGLLWRSFSKRNCSCTSLTCDFFAEPFKR